MGDSIWGDETILSFEAEVDDYFLKNPMPVLQKPYFHIGKIDKDNPSTNYYQGLTLTIARGSPASEDPDYEEIALIRFNLGEGPGFVSRLLDIKFWFKVTGLVGGTPYRYLVGVPQQTDFDIRTMTYVRRFAKDLETGNYGGTYLNDPLCAWTEADYGADPPVGSGFLPSTEGEGYVYENTGPSSSGGFFNFITMHQLYYNGGLSFSQDYQLVMLCDEPGRVIGFGTPFNVSAMPYLELVMACKPPKPVSGFKVSPHPDDPSVAIFEWDSYDDKDFVEFDLCQDHLVEYPARVYRQETPASGKRLLWIGKEDNKNMVCVNLVPDSSNDIGPMIACDKLVVDDDQPNYSTFWGDSTFSLYPYVAVDDDIDIASGVWTFTPTGWSGSLHALKPETVRIRIPVLNESSTQIIGSPGWNVGEAITLGFVTSSGNDCYGAEVDWGDGITTLMTYDEGTDSGQLSHVYTKSGNYTIRVRVYGEQGFSTRYYTVVSSQTVTDLPSTAELQALNKFKPDQKLIMNGALSHNIAKDVTIDKYEFALDYDSVAGTANWYDNGDDPILVIDDISSPPSPLVLGTGVNNKNLALRITDSNAATDIQYFSFSVLTAPGSTIDNPTDLGLSSRTAVNRRGERFSRRKKEVEQIDGTSEEVDLGVNPETFRLSCMTVQEDLHGDLEAIRNHINDDSYVEMIITDEPGYIITVIGKVRNLSVTRVYKRYASYEFEFRVHQRQVVAL